MTPYRRFSIWRVAVLLAGYEITTSDGMHLAFTSTGRVRGAFNTRLGIGHINR